MWKEAIEANSRIQHFYTLVAGVSFDNRDGTSRQEAIEELEVDDEMYLVWEPDNEADPQAVRVETKEGKQVGYVPSSLAYGVGQAMREGRVAFALVAQVLEPNASYDFLGLNLLVIEHAPDVAKEDVAAYVDELQAGMRY